MAKKKANGAVKDAPKGEAGLLMQCTGCGRVIWANCGPVCKACDTLPPTPGPAGIAELAQKLTEEPKG